MKSIVRACALISCFGIAVPICLAQATGGTPPAQQSCDARTAQEKAEWGKIQHNWLSNVFHNEHSDLSQTWCRIWETHGYDRVSKAEDFGRVLFTGDGIHPVVGSIVPGSGLAAGLTFNLSRALTSKPLRLSSQIAARGSINGYWVAGGQLKLLGSAPNGREDHISATFSVKHYAMPQLAYFGMGNSTARADETVFGLRTTRASATIEVPLRGGFGLSAISEGLWARSEGFHDSSRPSIEQTFAPADTPALNTDTTYVVYGGGLGWKYPSAERLRGYGTSASTLFRVFHETSGAPFSFRRFEAAWEQHYNPDTSVDLGTFSLISRLVESVATGANNVPFYLQPTLGGSDIDKVAGLRSYADYRFRAPNTISFQAEYTRSIRDPLGVLFFYDVGKVAVHRSDLSLDHMKHSFGVGLTLRAGGFSAIKLYYAWGGGEGTRTTFTTGSQGGNVNLQGVF